MGNSFVKVMPVPKEVPVGTGSIAFRGLSASDVSLVFSMFKDSAMAFFAMSDKGDDTDWSSLVLGAPEMVARIIAMGSGIDQESDEEMEAIRQLPLGEQAACLGAIYSLSVPNEKKFLDQLQSLLSKLRNANKRGAEEVSQLKTPSSTPSLDGPTTSAEQATDSTQ